MKKRTFLMAWFVFFVLLAIGTGCSQEANAQEQEKPRDFGTEYNFRTDFQYSYECTANYDVPVQSDGTGQYISRSGFVYYYNPEKKIMTPLCNKPNCLHDQETDWLRLQDCNACALANLRNAIQYYDGAVYSIVDYAGAFSSAGAKASLCRITCDGGKKDILCPLDYGSGEWPWVIHRGYLYYCSKSFFTVGEGKDQKVCSQFTVTVKSVKLSSHMDTEKHVVIYESDKNHHTYSVSRLVAYKDYLFFNIVANELSYDPEKTTVEDWLRQVYSPAYIYNMKTGETKIITVPEGYSEASGIGDIAFLKDQLLVKIYDNLQPREHPTQIYRMNFDLTDCKVWMDNVPQGKNMKCFGDYIILMDANLRFDYVEKDSGFMGNILKEGESLYTNIEVFSSDAKPVAHCVYPQALIDPIGFGPDGVRLEIEKNEEDLTWSVYRLKFDDVLRCHGETVEPELISTRKIGSLFKNFPF